MFSCKSLFGGQYLYIQMGSNDWCVNQSKQKKRHQAIIMQHKTITGASSSLSSQLGTAWAERNTLCRHSNQEAISCELEMGCNWISAAVWLEAFICLNHPGNPVSKFQCNKVYLQLMNIHPQLLNGRFKNVSIYICISHADRAVKYLGLQCAFLILGNIFWLCRLGIETRSLHIAAFLSTVNPKWWYAAVDIAVSLIPQNSAILWSQPLRLCDMPSVEKSETTSDFMGRPDEQRHHNVDIHSKPTLLFI